MAMLFIASPSRACEVVANNALYRKHVELFHNNTSFSKYATLAKCRRQEQVNLITKGNEVVSETTWQYFCEPKDCHRSNDFSFARNCSRDYKVENTHAIRRHHQQQVVVIRENVGVPNLALVRQGETSFCKCGGNSSLEDSLGCSCHERYS